MAFMMREKERSIDFIIAQINKGAAEPYRFAGASIEPWRTRAIPLGRQTGNLSAVKNTFPI